MFIKKMLLKTLKSLTPEEKEQVRKSLEDEPQVVDEEVSEEENKGETEMVEEEKNEKEEVTEQKDAGEVTEQTNMEEQKEEENTETEQQPEVQQISETGNGYRIEDLVTKEDFQAQIAALEAKFAAVVKENEDLKEKYENKDFGGFNKKGIIENDKKTRAESYDDYAKDYM